jgi:hypothetical protein
MKVFGPGRQTFCELLARLAAATLWVGVLWGVTNAQQPSTPSQNALPPSSAKKAPDLDSTQTAIVSAAAIAAVLVEESRKAYYATGRPCACPEDLMRNGRPCGGNSAHSRPGGARPYCYPSDVPLRLIQSYQDRLSEGIK